MGRDLEGGLSDATLQSGQTDTTEWKEACGHEVQQNPKCPDIDIMTHVAVPPENLRGHVRRRATEGGKDFIGLADRAKAKIGHLSQAAGGENDVLCFQVSVDNILVML